MSLKSLINKIMVKPKKEKITKDESKPLVGKKITTKSDVTKLQTEVVKLKPNEKHEVIDESVNAVKTDKSNGAWISKTSFEL